jgi:hypothetical protein
MTAAFSLAVSEGPNGTFSVLANTSTYSTLTGALTVAGGMGIGGGLTVGGIITATNFIVNGYAVSTASALTIQGYGSNLGTAGIINFTTGLTATVATNVATLSIVTSTLMTTAVNLAGGSAGQFAYQTAAGATSFTSTGSMYVYRATLADSVTNFNTSTLMTTAVNLNGGTAGQVPYQTAAGATSFYGPGTAGQLLVSAGASAPVYTSTSSIYVNSAVNAQNLFGGSAGQFAYQTAAGATSFVSTSGMYVNRATLADSASQVANAVTFNNGNTGAASGSTFNGSSVLTVSANTLGALSLTAGGTVSGAVTFSGPVTFSGTSTTIASTNTVYTDNIIELHAPPTGVNSPWFVDDGKDIGLRFHYYTNSTDTNAALVLANDTKYLEWYSAGAEGTSTFAGSSYGTFKTGNVVVTSRVGIGQSNTSTGSQLYIAGTGNTASGNIVYLRDTSATALNTSSGGIVFGSSPGNDYYIAKRNDLGVSALVIGEANTPTEFARFTSAGAFGLGTTAPTFGTGLGLHIQNSTRPNIRLTQTSSTDGYEMFVSGTTFYPADNVSGTNGAVIWRNIATRSETMRIDINGVLKKLVSSSTGVESTATQFWDGSANLGSIRTYNSSGYNQDIRLYTAAGTSSSTESLAMTLNSAGNIGIGTSSPGFKLDIASGDINMSVNQAIRYAGYWTLGADSTNLISVGSQAGGVAGARKFGVYTDGGASGTAALFITTSTNVGIGTTSPSAKLHVSGTSQNLLYLQTTNTEANIRFDNSVATSNFFGATNGANFFWASGGSEWMRLDSSGRLGVGTSSPDNGRITILKNSSYATSSTYGISIQSNATNAYTELLIGADDSIDAGVIQTAGKNTSWSSKSLILQPNGGPIGIGTTSPNRILEVKNSGSASQLRLSSANGNMGVEFVDYSGLGYYNWQIGAQYQVGNALTFTPSSAGNGTTFTTPVMTLLSGGNVGVGTTAPGAKLHVYNPSSSNSSANIKVENQYAGVNVALQIVSTSRAWDVGQNILESSTGSLEFYDRTATAQRMKIDSSGIVGIGVTNPSNFATRFAVNANSTARGVNFDNAGANGVNLGFSNNGTDVGFLGSAKWVTNGTLTDFAIGSVNNLIFAQNGNERARIDGSGNFGIGTTAPNQRLDVRGSVSIGGTTNGIWLGYTGDNSAYDNVTINYTGYNSGAPQVIFQPRTTPGSGILSTAYYFKNSNANSTSSNNRADMYVDGYVGIGTNNPGAKLTVVQSYGQTTTMSVSPYSAWTSQIGGFPGSVIATSNSAGVSSAASLLITCDYNQPLVFGRFYNGSTSYTESARFDSSGNFGIGTTAPTTALTVRKPIDSSAYGAGTSMIDFKSYYPGYDTETVKASIYAGVSGRGTLNTQGGYLAFMVNLDGTMGEKMRIEKTGNVGIGTTVPGAPLEIKVPSDGDFFINRHQSGTAKLIYGYQYASDGYLEIRSGADNIVSKLSGYTGTPSYFLSNTGFGTSSPDSAITFAGNITSKGNDNYGIGTNGGNNHFNVFSTGASGAIRFWTGGSSATSAGGGGTERVRIDSSGNLIPNGDNLYNLGASSNRWANVYTADMHFSNEGTEGNSVDGTTGNWTLQEGEDNIYMLNNKTGKRYKIKLEEV